MNEDLPNVESIIAPLNIQEQREAFGGPLYQMMNPSGKKIADAVSGGINSLKSDPTNLMAGGFFVKKGVKYTLPMLEDILQKFRYAQSLRKTKIPKDKKEASNLERSLPFQTEDEIINAINTINPPQRMNLKLFEELRKKHNI